MTIMKALIFTIIFVLATAVIGRAAPLQPKNVNIGVNQTKAIRGTQLSVKFVEMVEDSRCPRDVNCIWAGNAKIRVTVTKRGSAPQTIQLNTMQSGEVLTAHGYRLRLVGLTPTPASNIRINRNGYIANIEFTKLAK